MTKKNIKLVRIYDHGQPNGYRILVDRLWPRGISKIKANLDNWNKEIAPTNELRKWFNHEDDKFILFSEKYFTELDNNPLTPKFINLVDEKLKTQDVLFLYGAKNKNVNQAIVLKKYIKSKL